MTHARRLMQHGQRGFTIVETLVVVAVTAVMMSVALPSFTTLLRKFRVNAVVTTLEASLQRARAEAIQSNARVLVCSRERPGAVRCGQSNNWGGYGWLVCYDVQGLGSCNTGSANLINPILLVAAQDASQVTVTGPTVPLRFNPDGSQGPSGAVTKTLTTRGGWSGAPDLATTVAPSGFIKVTKP